ncbi:hypothetical protein CMK20_17845 [Candidatus Poribacteria bacterium]|nr:hypothetical protein [Candidatus Poribacteria bacterium]
MLSIALSFWTVKKKADFLASNDRLMIEKKFYLFKAIEKIDQKNKRIRMKLVLCIRTSKNVPCLTSEDKAIFKGHCFLEIRQAHRMCSGRI